MRRGCGRGLFPGPQLCHASEWGGSRVLAPKRKEGQQSFFCFLGDLIGSRNPWVVLLTAQLLQPLQGRQAGSIGCSVEKKAVFKGAREKGVSHYSKDVYKRGFSK